ncbi:MAG: EamA family transporter [Segetibacter sp.]
MVFPLLSLTPVVTILLAVVFLKEKTGRLGWIGIVVAIIAILLLSYQPPGDKNVSGYLWMMLAAIPLLAWGAQGFVMRFANETMKAESIFFYMTISSVLLIPLALSMTDFSQPINWGFKGPYLAGMIQVLNAFRCPLLSLCFQIWESNNYCTYDYCPFPGTHSYHIISYLHCYTTSYNSNRNVVSHPFCISDGS